MEDEKSARGSRVLRFAVSSALLVLPMTSGCGTEEVSVNEPPIQERPVEETINEPAPEETEEAPADPAAPAE